MRKYQQVYGSPIVFGQVHTENDTGWSHFWSCGGTSSDPADADDIMIGKAVGEDTDTVRSDEGLAFITIQSGAGNINGVNYIAELGSDIVEGVDDSPPYEYTFGTSFATDPEVAIVAQAGMDGNDGSWAMLYGSDPLSTTKVKVAVDEDQITDSERGHTTEQVGYLVFESAFAYEATFKMEAGTVTANDDSYSSVDLVNTYCNPVVVCTGNAPSSMSKPFITRAKSAFSDGFQVKVQNPSGNSIYDKTVHYVVVEAGSWTLPDGRKMEAQKTYTRQPDYEGSWAGKSLSYIHAYTEPVVLGQVMTAGDADWSHFWCCGELEEDPPDNGTLYVGNAVGEDTDTDRELEVLGVIVVEAGSGSINGIDYVADVGAATVHGFEDSPPYTYSLSPAFSSAPEVAILTQAGMNGSDGAWALLYNNGLRTNAVDLCVDEDKIYDEERNHVNEENVGYFIFESDFSYSD